MQLNSIVFAAPKCSYSSQSLFKDLIYVPRSKDEWNNDDNASIPMETDATDAFHYGQQDGKILLPMSAGELGNPASQQPQKFTFVSDKSSPSNRKKSAEGSIPCLFLAFSRRRMARGAPPLEVSRKTFDGRPSVASSVFKIPTFLPLSLFASFRPVPLFFPCVFPTLFSSSPSSSSRLPSSPLPRLRRFPSASSSTHPKSSCPSVLSLSVCKVLTSKERFYKKKLQTAMKAQAKFGKDHS